MPELRIDPLSGARVIIAAERAGRPGHAPLTAQPPAPVDAACDPFLAGHEDQTPPALHAVPDGPDWRVRVVPNRFPALVPDAHAPPPQAATELLRAAPAVGAHEVIVHGRDAVASLADLEPAAVAEVLEVWRARIRHHAEAGAAAVHLFVNERPEGGSSIEHAHAQLVALPFVPAALARERERFSSYAASHFGSNLLADVVQEEVKLDERLVAVDREAVLLSPWAAPAPYAVTVVPRRPRPRFEDEGPLGAALLHDALTRLSRVLGAVPPLNLWVRTAPRGADHFCWRIDVVPRLAPLGGLELGAGLAINVVSPEQAAAELRAAA